MTTGPRHRLINSAIALMRERGVHATGLADLLSHSGTARGSIYQHFPGGKAKLIEEATLAAGRRLESLLESTTPSRTPSKLIEALVQWWKDTLESSSYRLGCPIVAAALAGSATPEARTAAATVFATWEHRLTASLADAGLERPTARSFATFLVSALEGAVIQAQSAESLRPLDDARVHLTALLDKYLDERPAP